MKQILPFLLFLPFYLTVNAQHYLYPSAQPKFVNENNDTLPYPFAGGLLTPQFSNIDLNQNGIQDLFVFDSETNKVLTFLNNGNVHKPHYYYAPQYEEFFPLMTGYTLLVDYNNDGKADIFTYNPIESSFSVYMNTSSNGQLSFTKVYDYLFTQLPPPGDSQILSVTRNNLPAIADIDGDGKIDILTYDFSSSKVLFYRNIATHPDSLRFKTMDQCWGRYYATPDPNNRYMLFDPCPFNVKWKMHPGGSLLALDIDGDGDMDILAGDAGYNKLTLIVNGKRNYNYPIDTMMNVVYNFPPSKPVDIQVYNAAFYVDVNNDGKRDLVVSAFNQLGHAATKDQVWLYMNEGQDNNPDFVFKKENFFQDGMIDHGSHAAPAFFDYNGIGLPDLFIAARGNRKHTLDNADRIFHYKNIGKEGFPVFKLVDEDFLNISQINIRGLTLAFGDLNGNGSIDLLLGNSKGDLISYKNTAGQGQTANFALESLNYHNINVGGYSAPAIFDIDKDGKVDLLVGNEKGVVHFYRNTGTNSQPVFTLITDSFGGMHAKEKMWFYDYDHNWNKIDSSFIYTPHGYAAPVVTDLNKDGKMEILLGSKYGRVRVYTNIEGNLNGHFTEIDTVFYDYGKAKGMDLIFDHYTKPAVAYLNNDTFPDVVIGVNRGGILFYGSIDSGTGIPPIVSSIKGNPKERINMLMFPNPAQNEVHFQFDRFMTGNNTIQLFNLTGKLLLQKEFSNINEYSLKLPELITGLYIVKITGKESGIIINRKLVISP